MGKFKKLMVPPQWKEYWTAYPHGYTILEALVDWISEFNDIVENVNDWNEYLDDFVKTFDFELQEEVKRTISKWQSEGLLDAIIESALETELDNIKSDMAQIAINVKSFGAIGDGVANDTNAFKEAFLYAVQNGYKVKIPKGNYNIVSTEDWVCPQIISDGATINITGDLRLLFDSNVYLENFTINTDDGGGKGVDYISTGRGTLFKPKTEDTIIEWAYINGVTIKGNVCENERVNAGITLPTCLKWVDVQNINTENVITTLWVKSGSKNISIKNIHGKNAETLVWLQDFENAIVDNVSIKNTKEQSKWWVGKNTGTNSNGKDVVLTEGGTGLKLLNVKGEWAIERPIYCQSTDVYADNLESINTGCFKFVGGINEGESRIDNIYIGTAIIRRTDDNVLDNVGQIYGCENIYYDNLKIFCEPHVSPGPFRIGGNNGKIKINKIERYGGVGPLLETVGSGNTDELIINEVFYQTSGNFDGNGLLLFKRGTGMISNFEVKKAKLKVDETYTARYREAVYNPQDFYLNAKIGTLEVEGIQPPTASGVYGFVRLTNTEIAEMIVKPTIARSLIQGTTFLNSGLTVNKATNIKVVYNANGVQFDIDISKKDEIENLTTDYIKQIHLKVLSSSDGDIYAFPTLPSLNWLFKIKSKIGGYAEFRYINGTLTEVFNTGTNIVIGDLDSVPAGGKITIRKNTDGLVEVRNRNTSDSYEVEVINLSVL